MKKAEKPETIVSGSFDTQEEIQEVQEVQEVRKSKPAQSNDDMASDLLKQILDATMIDTLIQESYAENTYIVQSEDGSPLWLLSLTSKSFRLIHDKSEITMMEKIDDNISHCMINNDLYEVRNELIKDIGWN